MVKRRKELEEELAEQTLTAEKVTEQTKDTVVTAATPAAEAE